MLDNVVLVSSVQQSESAIRIHIFPLFWVSFPFRSPQNTEFPMLYSMFSLIICFLRGSVHMPISIKHVLSPFLSPPSRTSIMQVSVCLCCPRTLLNGPHVFSFFFLFIVSDSHYSFSLLIHSFVSFSVFFVSVIIFFIKFALSSSIKNF